MGLRVRAGALGAPVYALTYQLVLEPDVAEDLTQETFLKAFEKLTSYQPELPFAPWILTIANRKALDSDPE